VSFRLHRKKELHSNWWGKRAGPGKGQLTAGGCVEAVPNVASRRETIIAVSVLEPGMYHSYNHPCSVTFL
jgi:hypothetical protein